MQYVDTILWWTGLVTWIVMSGPIASWIGRTGRAIRIAIDVVRWRMAVCRVHGKDLRWVTHVVAFAGTSIQALAMRPGDRMWVETEFGRWDGLGKWSIYSPVDIRKD